MISLTKRLIHFFFIPFLLVILISTAAFASTYRFALFAPRNDPFWLGMEAMMQATCADLKVECEVYYSYDNQYEMLRQMERAMTGKNKVDAIIFQNFKLLGAQFIKLAEKHKVAAFLLNAPLSAADYQVMGKPREKYKFWLGEMLPDDEWAGEEVANILIDAAIQKGKLEKEGKIGLIAINGITSDGAAIERMKGLNNALRKRNDVILYQAFNGYWESEQGRSKFLHAYGRYPQTDVVWAASDNIAIGVVQGIEALGMTPGVDVLTGGINWSAQGIQAVESGVFEMSIGGHLMEASWSVIMLYDYFQGIDFNSEGVSFKSGMYAIRHDEGQNFQQIFSRKNWGKIDFQRFSKHYNPELKKYRFDVQNVLEQLKELAQPQDQ
ncbi:ABC transporter periplasmic-binding protein YtfQ precursor [Vibrio aerogenes CECT 7868]|uniref:Autoinducer 2-binding periplasmic protein LuxP n=1 Tax=Vibrio aerogenes CECT 7868 TaxID=1216006 RepID=A0A1M6DL12_9VIBR|nr:ABC transporter substrate-binding protein [Vibrio aerogenes]SHI74004.1 ABC transporter periplasmic-binding protein YtfQ precursor [Vibrio aerogenes CECT 7868]